MRAMDSNEPEPCERCTNRTTLKAQIDSHICVRIIMKYIYMCVCVCDDYVHLWNGARR